MMIVNPNHPSECRQYIPAASQSQRLSRDGRDDAGQEVASGVYLYRLRTDTSTRAFRNLLLRSSGTLPYRSSIQ